MQIACSGQPAYTQQQQTDEVTLIGQDANDRRSGLQRFLDQHGSIPVILRLVPVEAYRSTP